jgi:quercetin dioxygenase-like cupin family protein
MAKFTRRSMLVALSAGAVVLGNTFRALAQQQDTPGVQRGEVKKFNSMIPGVANITVQNQTYQPGAKTSRAMPHSMVCECTAGVLEVSQDSMTTTMKTGDMWTCHKGMVETVVNKGTIPAVMRVIQLVPA